MEHKYRHFFLFTREERQRAVRPPGTTSASCLFLAALPSPEAFSPDCGRICWVNVGKKQRALLVRRDSAARRPGTCCQGEALKEQPPRQRTVPETLSNLLTVQQPVAGASHSSHDRAPREPALTLVTGGVMDDTPPPPRLLRSARGSGQSARLRGAAGRHVQSSRQRGAEQLKRAAPCPANKL